MQITIIGYGNVGGALGERWSRAGHEVIFGVRDPRSDKVEGLLRKLDRRASAAGVRDAAAAGEIVVLATPWPAAEAAIREAGDLAGKILFDCTNPLLPDLSGLAVGHETSGGELVAGWAEGAKVVKVFNTTGAGNMSRPAYGGAPVTMLYAGDDGRANATADTLIRDVGFEPVFLGPLRCARLMEPFALVWITLAYQRGYGPDFSLQVVQRPS